MVPLADADVAVLAMERALGFDDLAFLTKVEQLLAFFWVLHRVDRRADARIFESRYQIGELVYYANGEGEEDDPNPIAPHGQFRDHNLEHGKPGIRADEQRPVRADSDQGLIVSEEKGQVLPKVSSVVNVLIIVQWCIFALGLCRIVLVIRCQLVVLFNLDGGVSLVYVLQFLELILHFSWSAVTRLIRLGIEIIELNT